MVDAKSQDVHEGELSGDVYDGLRRSNNPGDRNNSDDRNNSGDRNNPLVGELDELETFVGSKKNKIWLWTAVNHFSQGILGWVLGDHSAETFKPLWEFVSSWQCYFYQTEFRSQEPEFRIEFCASGGWINGFKTPSSARCLLFRWGLNPQRKWFWLLDSDFWLLLQVTDGWKVYPQFIDSGDHIVSKTYMTRVEGENTRLRHYLARLHRKTLCYSKSVEMLKYSIQLLLHYLKYRSIPIFS